MWCSHSQNIKWKLKFMKIVLKLDIKSWLYLIFELKLPFWQMPGTQRDNVAVVVDWVVVATPRPQFDPAKPAGHAQYESMRPTATQVPPFRHEVAVQLVIICRLATTCASDEHSASKASATNARIYFVNLNILLVREKKIL
jgi:hypothetical protein